MEICLVGIFLLSLAMRALIHYREKHGYLSSTVTRGDQSMGTLYTMYGVATVIATLTIDVAEAFKGYKSILILFNYLIITYLFFYSSWFRNVVFFPEINRIKED